MNFTKRCITAVSAIAVSASAAAWPTKPVTFIVPYPPGGGTDVIARIVQEPLSKQLGQPIVIENRGGAGGSLGTAVAARAAPDGHTMLFTLSSHSINPAIYDKLPFDTERDFRPVSMVASLPQLFAVHPGAPFKTFEGLVAYMKSHPGKVDYASVGVGSPSHLAGELLKMQLSTYMVHIPYRGGGPAVAATMAGDVPVLIVSIPAAMSQVRAGRLVPLAVSTCSSRAPKAAAPRPRRSARS
jgi:tripartite-type tricarboxylate transporter receptor subunit TctC